VDFDEWSVGHTKLYRLVLITATDLSHGVGGGLGGGGGGGVGGGGGGCGGGETTISVSLI